jgi:hypothetical protein
MEITVIDERALPGLFTPGKFAGPGTNLYETWVRRSQPVYMRNVNSMVHGVLTRLRGAKMSRLNIVDHGNETGFEIGDDLVTEQSLGTFAPQLAQLRGRFAPKGFVHLQHCKVGEASTLLIDFSALVGVRVYGGSGYDFPGFNTGDYWGCDGGTSICRVQKTRP